MTLKNAKVLHEGFLARGMTKEALDIKRCIDLREPPVVKVEKKKGKKKNE